MPQMIAIVGTSFLSVAQILVPANRLTNGMPGNYNDVPMSARAVDGTVTT